METVDEIEKLFDSAVAEPSVIAVGHPTKFRRVKYIMALAKGRSVVVIDLYSR